LWFKIWETCEDVVFVSDGDPRVVLEVPELDLTASDHGVRSVAVVIVVNGAVVDHGRQVRMVVLLTNRSLLVLLMFAIIVES